ncbi:MAG: hypothetical protein GY948_12100 [Alphaproteobacteria bacterium]|nr:hypothetical protein [Alphaproteobacteria bacterium]
MAELDQPEYLDLVPHFQIAIDDNLAGPPNFFYVGEQSLTAKLLGHNFTPAMHAGEWWDDGGYAMAISDVFPDVSTTGEPTLEEIKAPILPPSHWPSRAPIVLHYDRLSLPSMLDDGQKTFTIVTTRKSMLQVVN